ncbi:hypothetical protein SAMN06297129_1956 [Pseudooceanicola antarcticus]|uniref:Uncharacterized protein n=1 Tax=Pseudooceanicola antarcticus TaxID=1247613 RepID=A0A285ISP0_9RHOB|nr:hypothetical protein [Pseudooceanicola antarcticus]PJE31916.1 hypothetical protein CVM39_02110 [Pseudooceanicola antarcticus]SNY50833.1 hypothetical protein SAMN06297129_1956 [Pseudooceanicola antarcticus]
MRNAALILGLVGGLMALVVGFAAYGYTEAIRAWGEVDGLFHQVANVEAMRTAGLLSPILAIAGAGMARSRALWAGVLMLASVAGFYMGFGVTFFTLFPMAFIAIAGLLALAAGRPDEPVRHF